MSNDRHERIQADASLQIWLLSWLRIQKQFIECNNVLYVSKIVYLVQAYIK